jgi:serine/threonine-protein kinase
MDGALINDLGKLLKWLSSLVSRKLRQPNTVEESWDDLLGHKSSATAYFEEYILPNTAKPVVLALDEIDRLFDNEQVAADFFGLLRGWHELSKDQAVWAKLRLIVVHSTEVYVSLGVKESPFNVGLSVRPPEFTPQQLEELANRHGYPLSPSVCAELLRLVGGHPFLSRVALYAFAKGEMSPAVFFKTASTEEGRYSDHLRRHLWNLEQNPSLLRAMRTILAADHQPVRIDAMEAFKLESMGLVTRHGNGVTVRYELYANYLRDRLEGRN